MAFRGKRLAIWSWLALGSVLCALSSGAQESALPFSDGEKLQYTVQWRLFPAGHAELLLAKEEAQPSRWKATAKAHSTGYVSNLYKVENEYQSTFHNPTFCSAGIHKVIHEGDRHREVSLQFDQNRQMALLHDRDTTSDTSPRQEQFSIPACVYDLLSVLYYARTQPLEIGESFKVPVNDGSRTTLVRVEIQAREEIQSDIGMFPAIRLEPDVSSANLFKEKGRMFVWFSDDENRLPVQLKVQIPAGTIIASLAGVDRWESDP